MQSIKNQTYSLIDELKATCQQAGLGNDGNEFKIITQVFLYKFLNDKFIYECKKLDIPIARKLNKAVSKGESWETAYSKLSEDEYETLTAFLDASVAKFKPEHMIGYLWNQQAKGDFDVIFDATMADIGNLNVDIFSTLTAEKTKIPLFENLMPFITDANRRPEFARALVDKLARFSFESAFSQSYDFFAAIFEYLIKDYNTAGGGKYAEYYTPHAIATIMARMLVPENADLHSIECYDPSAGTGTLLMALAHQVGEDRCTIYSQDISQKSNKLLKLNLLLNGLVSSLDNVIQGDTLTSPFHKASDGVSLKQFDFIVSNPPFNMDFSDTREKIAQQQMRFWAGVPKVPQKEKGGMAIYTCFVQHVINSLKDTGRGAVVIPTGFITSKKVIESRILKKIVDDKIVSGCVSMPSNVFATTGTNVSVLFLDKSSSERKDVVLIDASKLGEEYKDNGIKKVRLRKEEINKIVDTFQQCKTEDDFSVVVSYEKIKEKGYSLSAGQYFDIKLDHVDITEKEFNKKIAEYQSELSALFAKSSSLEKQIQKNLKNLKFSNSENL